MGWLIAGGIILFIIILLAVPVVIRFEYAEQLRLQVRYLFLTLYRIPAKPQKQRGSKRVKKQKEPEQAETPEKPERREKKKKPPTLEQKVEEALKTLEAEKVQREQYKGKLIKNPKAPTLTEIFELVKTFVDSLGSPLKKLLKRIKIIDFELSVICGGEDAAKAALKFGTVNLATGNALGYLDSWFTLKDPHIDINVDFQSEETKTDCSCTVKLSALVLLSFVFSFVGRLIGRVLKNTVVKGYLGRLMGKQQNSRKSKKSK